METLWLDLRYSARGLLKKPLGAFIVVVTLALGIGANTAIFSFVNALLLTALPFRDSERLVHVASLRGNEPGLVSTLEVADLNHEARLFEGFAASRSTQYNIAEGGEAEVVFASMNTYNLFELLGAHPIHGETWPANVDRTVSNVAVVSHRLWQRRYSGDPSLVGRTITMDGAPYHVAGILPPGFNFPVNTDIYRRSPPGDYDNRGIRQSAVIAKLKPGVTIAQAQAEIDAIARQWEQTYPETNAGLRFTVEPLRDLWLGKVGPYLWLSLGAVGLVLLIACANVAGLLLARALAREKEIAIRAALGASRARIARLLLTESLVFAMCGGLCGLLFGFWGVGLLSALIRIELPAWVKVGIDFKVLAFTIVVSTIAGIVAGLFPALQSSKADLNQSLKDGGRGLSGAAAWRTLRSALVVAEIALALVLLAGAGLLVQSLRRLLQTDAGFDASRLLTLQIDPPYSRYNKVEQTAPYYRRVIAEIEALPGVESAAVNDSLPLSFQEAQGSANRTVIYIEGQTIEEQRRAPYVNLQIVSPGYLRAMKIPLLRGRAFDERDSTGSTMVALVSERMAASFWPGQSAHAAIGGRIRMSKLGSNYNPLIAIDPRQPKAEPEPWFTIVGVVGDVKQSSLVGEAGLDLYVSTEQFFAPEAFVVVRADGDTPSLLAPVKRAIAGIDPELGVYDVALMEERLSNTVWRQRVTGTLFGVFAALALLLASVGVYGVMSYAVEQRTREMGIRIALGARPRDVLRLIIREGLRLAVAGTGIGSLCALLLARAVSHLLYGVSANDPLIFFGVASALMSVALSACWFPARRAMLVDPIVALRDG
jgi:putative ABC transport system permease protein